MHACSDVVLFHHSGVIIREVTYVQSAKHGLNIHDGCDNVGRKEHAHRARCLLCPSHRYVLGWYDVACRPVKDVSLALYVFICGSDM